MNEAGHTRIWLPFPPTANNLFAHGVVKGVVRRFPTKRYKAWELEAGLLINRLHLEPFDQPVVVKIALKPPDNRPRDTDNYVKPVMDILKKSRVLHDDSNRFVLSTTAYWDPEPRRPGAIVFIRLARVQPQPTQLPLGLPA
jgi:crossover junction endodeoxyribonuclease RusA